MGSDLPRHGLAGTLDGRMGLGGREGTGPGAREATWADAGDGGDEGFGVDDAAEGTASTGAVGVLAVSATASVPRLGVGFEAAPGAVAGASSGAGDRSFTTAPTPTLPPTIAATKATSKPRAVFFRAPGGDADVVKGEDVRPAAGIGVITVGATGELVAESGTPKDVCRPCRLERFGVAPRRVLRPAERRSPSARLGRGLVPIAQARARARARTTRRTLAAGPARPATAWAAGTCKSSRASRRRSRLRTEDARSRTCRR